MLGPFLALWKNCLQQQRPKINRDFMTHLLLHDPPGGLTIQLFGTVISSANAPRPSAGGADGVGGGVGGGGHCSDLALVLAAWEAAVRRNRQLRPCVSYMRWVGCGVWVKEIRIVRERSSC